MDTEQQCKGFLQANAAKNYNTITATIELLDGNGIPAPSSLAVAECILDYAAQDPTLKSLERSPWMSVHTWRDAVKAVNEAAGDCADLLKTLGYRARAGEPSTIGALQGLRAQIARKHLL